MATPAEMLEQMEGKFNKRIDALGAAVEKQLTEMRENGGVSTETKTQIEKHEAELAKLQEGLDEIAEMKDGFNDLKEAVSRPGSGQKGRISPGKSFSDSDEFKNWKEGRMDKSGSFQIGAMAGLLPDRKAGTLTTEEGVWGGAGLLTEPQLLPGIIREPDREIRFRDLVNVQQVSTDSVRYFKETGYANLYTELAAAYTSGTTITVSQIGGLFAGQTIVVGGDQRVIATGGIDSSNNQVTLTTALSGSKPAGTEVISDQLGGTPHGGRKPMSSIRFEDEVESLITLAHWVAAHRQTLEDVPQLQNYINERLLFGLEMALEDQAFYGTGTSTTLLGFFNHPQVQNIGTRSGTDNNGEPLTHIDWLRKAMTRAQVAEYPVNGFMVNPLDWEAIELMKDNQGRYLWITMAEGGVRRLFAVPVVVSNSVRAGDFLAGAFGLGATLLDRAAATIRISDSHESFFVQNALAILAELRVGLMLTRPEAIVKGKF